MKQLSRTSTIAALATSVAFAPAGAIAQTSSDLVGHWILENITHGYEQLIEFEETEAGLQVWQITPGDPVANSVSLSQNQISFDFSCRGFCRMNGEISADGLSGTLEFSNTEYDSPPSQYRMTKITEPYCPMTGVWEYYSESDFTYNSNSGFGDGGPPYRATVNITEDEDRNLTVSGFYNMSTGDGSGYRRVNDLNFEMPLSAGRGRVHASARTVNLDFREFSGVIYLGDERSNVSIPFTMTRQTECGDDGSPDADDVIRGIFDILF